jgi:ABC-type uncharacterized transport system fused permease/ATPase subunit
LSIVDSNIYFLETVAIYGGQKVEEKAAQGAFASVLDNKAKIVRWELVLNGM